MDPRARLPRVTLAQSLFGFVLVTLAVAAVAGGLLLVRASGDLVTATLDRSVRTRTEAAADVLARTLHADWRDLAHLAASLDPGDRASVIGPMAGMRGDGSRITWIGFADTGGTVRIATDGLLEGADVGERPWFRNGLRDRFAGDVHDAVLLAEAVAPGDGAPPRFVDLALPVRDASGEVVGVVGMHINATWLQSLLTEIGETLRIGLFLVDAAGEVSLAGAPVPPAGSDLSVLRAAQAGLPVAVRERWPDGREYFSSLVPSVQYRDLPDFGWRLIGRITPADFTPGLDGAWRMALVTLAAMVAVLGALSALYVMAFLRPLERIARVAERIADGAEQYPPETRSTREAAQISAAIARLQAGLNRDRD